MALSPRDRVLRAIHREPADCVAAGPYIYDMAAQTARVRLRDYYTNADTMVKAQLALQEIVGHDVIAIGCDNYYIAEGFGCRTTHEEDAIPSLERPAASSLAGVFDLEVPDPLSQGRMPVMVEAIRLARQAVGDEIAIRSPGTGPFALASHLVGSQQWLYEIGMASAGLDGANEAALHHAMGLATEALIRFGKACWDAGADLIHCGDSLASCDVISPQTYRRYALPYEQQLFRAWREHGITASLLHICGDSTQVLDSYVAAGSDLVEIDNKVDLSVVKRQIGNDVALIGNVHTVTDLLQGTPATVRAASQHCIDSAGAGGGFILGSGCIVPRLTPIENVQEMVRVAHSQPYPEC